MSTRRTIERRRRKASAACASIWRFGFGFGLWLWLWVWLCLLDDGLGNISGRREEGEDGEDGTGFEALLEGLVSLLGSAMRLLRDRDLLRRRLRDLV